MCDLRCSVRPKLCTPVDNSPVIMPSYVACQPCARSWKCLRPKSAVAGSGTYRDAPTRGHSANRPHCADSVVQGRIWQNQPEDGVYEYSRVALHIKGAPAVEYLGCRSERGRADCQCRRVPGSVTLVPGVCTWHLAEVALHGSRRRGSQRRRMEVVGRVRSRGRWRLPNRS